MRLKKSPKGKKENSQCYSDLKSALAKLADNRDWRSTMMLVMVMMMLVIGAPKMRSMMLVMMAMMIINRVVL